MIGIIVVLAAMILVQMPDRSGRREPLVEPME
jgi:hypothetical protein